MLIFVPKIFYLYGKSLIWLQANEVSEFYIGQDDYLQKLIPKWEEKATEKPALPSNVLSMTELKTMNLSDQVKLGNGGIHRVYSRGLW